MGGQGGETITGKAEEGGRESDGEKIKSRWRDATARQKKKKDEMWRDVSVCEQRPEWMKLNKTDKPEKLWSYTVHYNLLNSSPLSALLILSSS